MEKTKEKLIEIAKEIGDSMICHTNQDKNMNELFKSYLDRYTDDIKKEHIELLRLTVFYISNKGYEIVSTHPFKLELYK